MSQEDDNTSIDVAELISAEKEKNKSKQLISSSDKILL